MTYQQALNRFHDNVMPGIRKWYESDGIRDIPARREAWNNWTDGLCKNGEITQEQYDNWDNPF